MTDLTEQRLDKLLHGMDGKRIAVVGDLMLDRYIWGSVTRVSPEAPVPVVDMEQEQIRLGGAANVANNIRSLGGIPILVGVIGNDNSGKQLIELIRENRFPPEGIVIDGSRHTTVKTRVIAHSQHVVRIDRETKEDIAHNVQEKLLEYVRRSVDSLDGIIIEDYNKGVVVLNIIKELTALANEHKKIITVDPKFNNFFEYKNVTVFKPNRKEVEEVMGLRMRTDEDVIRAGKTILEKLHAEGVLLTRGEQGMTLFEHGGTISHVATKARNVADVSGAGDTVIATLTLALTGGASVQEAAALANFAGGIVCGYVGIVPIEKSELRKTVLQDSTPPARNRGGN